MTWKLDSELQKQKELSDLCRLTCARTLARLHASIENLFTSKNPQY